jgi:hypothetical protein
MDKRLVDMTKDELIGAVLWVDMTYRELIQRDLDRRTNFENNQR